MPKRIQRKREKGWRLPEDAVCVTRPGKWGNPYKVGERHPGFSHCPEVGIVSPPIENAAIAVKLFRKYALGRLAEEPGWLEPLRGKNLACWCKEDTEHCHADVLLDLANREPEPSTYGAIDP